uniref:Uncharacterized protein n=1 Tax=Glossina palpalis gambiensis TaxID=67801 RepID=A0A1B0B0Z9_9MUSC
MQSKFFTDTSLSIIQTANALPMLDIVCSESSLHGCSPLKYVWLQNCSNKKKHYIASYTIASVLMIRIIWRIIKAETYPEKLIMWKHTPNGRSSLTLLLNLASERQVKDNICISPFLKQE